MPVLAYNPNPPPLTQEELDAYAAEQEAMGGYVPAGGYVAEPIPEPAPAYAPVEPGMYDDPYEGPGIAATSTAHLYPPPQSREPLPPPPVEPGMYTPGYVGPGQYASGGRYGPEVYAKSQPPPVEPGMYDPPYASEGQVLIPPPERTVEPGMYSDAPLRYTSTGEAYGAMARSATPAPPRPAVTVAPTSGEEGYLWQQGDPAYVARPRLEGTRTHPVLRRDLATPIADRIIGLFGGGGMKSSQEMPLPPGTRRRVRNRGNH
jgi:hypothetical protein